MPKVLKPSKKGVSKKVAVSQPKKSVSVVTLPIKKGNNNMSVKLRIKVELV